MATANVGIALILSARNHASQVIEGALGRMEAKMKAFASGTAKIGAGIGEMYAAKRGVDALHEATAAFGDMEQAGNYLKATMMGSGGLFDQKLYDKVFQYTKGLSANYTGSTAAYLDMVRVMKQNRLEVGDVMGGIGESAAKLSIYFDNMLPAATAEFAAHMKNDMGVGVKEMYKVMDLTARIHDAGVGKTGMEAVTEMNEFFSKVGLGLSNLHAQGIETAKSMGALGALFMAKGISGQSVGTNFRRILDGIADGAKVKKANEIAKFFHLQLDFFDKNGKFKGVENFVNQIGKLQNLNPAAVNAILKPFSGKQGLSTDFMEFLATDGLNAYPEMVRKIEAQADLNKKVAVILEGQKMQGSVLESNVVNAKASFGAAIAAPYRGLLDILNRVTVAMGNFFDAHAGFAKVTAGVVAFISAAVGLRGVFTIVRGVGLVMKALGVVGPIATAVRWMNALKFAVFAVRFHFVTTLLPALRLASGAVMRFGLALLANPITWYVAGAVALGAAVYYIYKNWGKIAEWFSGVWGKVKEVWNTGIGGAKALLIGFTPVGWIYNNWGMISGWFSGMWIRVNEVWNGALALLRRTVYNLTPKWIFSTWNVVSGWFGRMWGRVVNIFRTAVKVVEVVLHSLTPRGIYENWVKLGAWFGSKMSEVVSIVTGIGSRLYAAGANIVKNIWEGMKSMAHKPIEAIADVMTKVRGYLPFSPAKYGALRDIHRIRLMETIAGGLRPAVLVRSVAGTMALVAASVAQPLPAIGMPKMPLLPVVKISTAWEVNKPVLPDMKPMGVVLPVLPYALPKAAPPASLRGRWVHHLPGHRMPMHVMGVPGPLAFPVVLPKVSMPFNFSTPIPAWPSTGALQGVGDMKPVPGGGLTPALCWGEGVATDKRVNSAASRAGGSGVPAASVSPFHVTINVTVNGGSGKEDGKLAGEAVRRELDKWYRDMMRYKARVGYGDEWREI